MKSDREEEERGKKRYRERLIQEQEAEEQIKNYQLEDEAYPDNDDSQEIPD